MLNIRFTDHARTSHVEQVSTIDKCFNGGGRLSGIFKMNNGRWSEFCDDGSKNNHWRIYECVGDERVVVTQFKQAVRKLKNYIQNHGMVAGEIPC